MADEGVTRATGYNGTIEFDGETVTVIRDNWRGRMGHGKNDRTSELAFIQRVDFELPSFQYKGYIRFAIPGITAEKPENDPYCVLFVKKQVDEFTKLRDVVKRKLSARSESEKAALRERAAHLSSKPEVSKPLAIASYGGYTARGDAFDLPKGAGVKTLSGAEAVFESGSDTSRPTLTRIGAGALLAGPIGAVGGALLKKNTTKAYVTIVFADGDTVIIEGPIKDEMKMRQFAADFNSLATN